MGNKSIIKHNVTKKNGEKVTYVYWGNSYYNKELKRTDNKKIAIGKMNERNEFVPNKNFLEMPIEEQLETGLITKPYLTINETVNATIAKSALRTKCFGWVAIIEKAAEDIKLIQTLKSVFPESYTTLMNLVESSLTLGSTLYNTKRFHDIYWDFAGRMISKDEVSDALKEANIKKEDFFSAFAKSRPERKEYSVCTIDSTSFSTYSALLQLAKYGFYKDEENLEQTDVIVVFEEDSGIPIFYRTVAGNVFDKKILDKTINEMTTFDYNKKLLLVMDKEFWDKESLKILLESPYDFIMSIPSTDSTYLNIIEKNREELKLPRSYIPKIKQHCVVVDYEPKDNFNNNKEMSLYIYFDPDNVSNSWKRNCEKFINTLNKLNSGEIKYNPKQSSFIGEYFIPVYDAEEKEIISYKSNNESQKRCLENCGVYVCLASKGMDKLKVYKNNKQRQDVEYGFESIKERGRENNEVNFDEYVFCDFLKLIVECSLRQKMRESALDKKYTLDEIKEIIDSARYYIPEDDNIEGEWIELTQEQQIILYSMGITEIKNQYPDVERLLMLKEND